jgi:ubiquinone/menaquinone biosynthesis C-methylase UbiE
MTDTFQISLEQAKAYEERFVPALFAQWAPHMVDVAEVVPGHRVLDVACGTGVVARAVAERTDPALVVGLDVNPAMLEVARSVRPDIEWREGDAQALPFGDGSFHAALCQSALFFFPDPDVAIAEMARVVDRGGVVAVQTYAGLEAQPGYRRLVDVVVEHTGEEARGLLETYWSQGDLAALGATLEAAGLEVVESRSRWGTARYGSVDELVHAEIGASPLADRVTPDQVEAISRGCAERLGRFAAADGRLPLPILAHMVAGRRR